MAKLMDSNLPDKLRLAIRPKKLRSKLAYKACRYAIMVGDALSRSQMEAVVRKLSELERPWNCPHGRPTCRFLKSL